MQNFSASPREMAASFVRNRQLISALVKREVVGRYRGSFVGILWSFLNPIFMLAVYTFVFSIVFKARWGTGSDSKTEFALVLFAGLIMFNLFAECVGRAPAAILVNVNYVKKVVFPLEILPWVNMGAALFHMLVSVGVWLMAYVIFYGGPSATILLLPVVMVPLVFFIMGVSWALASLGVYFRDVSQFIGIVITVLMFMSPIFYPVNALPEEYRGLLELNPLTPAIQMAREVMFWRQVPDLVALVQYYLGSIVVALLGFAWFQKTRKGFADVL
ncbi:ABC transporter permease [Pseudomonas viridiflava]|uniref:ABC transporter permease n=1 Tax=Pseudomonas viridiflava TaxID=33069 RepID=UPI0015E3CF1A|nr:ABC transporter permease [Pseudomonas viridiflava]MBA1232871.1 ABC transporter permease [Pseudomonas viridiflava]